MHLTDKYIKGHGDNSQENRAQAFTVVEFQRALG